MFHKILITGNAGSGKTTFSYKLAKLLKTNEVIHLDNIVWKRGWKLTDKKARDKFLLEITRKQTWIVDGVSKIILKDADTIFFLDYPRYLCYLRAFKRTLKYAFRPRPELPQQSPDSLAFGKILNIIWKFPKLVRPIIMSHLEENIKNKSVYHIRSDKELAFVFTNIKDQCDNYDNSHNYQINR